jgi:ClpP class serine protease
VKAKVSSWLRGRKPGVNIPRGMTCGEYLSRDRPVSYLALAPHAMQAVYRPIEIEPSAIAAGVGVMYIRGELDNIGGWWGDNYELIQRRFYSMIASPEVAAIAMIIGSPGGNAEGLNATVEAMIRRREKFKSKRVFVYCDDGAYSAAYALAMVADEVYIPPTGGVGSIGVVARLCSYQGAYKKMGLDVRLVTSGLRKSDGNPDAAITDEAEAHVRSHVMMLAREYWKLVAKRRGLRVSEVKEFEANTFYGSDAVAAGLADGVMALEDVMRYAARVARLSMAST